MKGAKVWIWDWDRRRGVGEGGGELAPIKPSHQCFERGVGKSIFSSLNIFLDIQCWI